MEKINIKNLIAQGPHKIVFAERDMSVAGVSAAQAQLSFVVNENLDCDFIRMDLFCACNDLSTTAPFSFFAALNLGKIASADATTIEAEINKFLNSVQIALLFNSHSAQEFLDEEYEHLETIYPDFDITDMDSNIEKFADQPFKVVESVDNTTSTVFGFINETMYFVTDKVIPKDVFEVVEKINPLAELSAFSKNAQLPIH